MSIQRFFRICFIISFLLLTSCGHLENMCDEANYESLSSEEGTIELISCGEVIATYLNAEVIYSSSDTMALWFEDSDGRVIYWQGDVRIFIY